MKARRVSRRPLPVGSIGVALLAIGGVFAVAGCSLLLDFDGGIETVPPDGGIPAQSCQALEPNDAPGDAMPLEAGSHDLAICPASDVDYYSFDLTEAQDVTVEIQFENADGSGDLDLRLLAADETPIAVSMGLGDSELIEESLNAGSYLIEVSGFIATVQNQYSMALTIE